MQGRGIGMGNTCKSMADSCQCITETTTNCKVISLQLIKINGKKNQLDAKTDWKLFHKTRIPPGNPLKGKLFLREKKLE